MKTEQNQEQDSPGTIGARREAEHLARLVLDAPKPKKARSCYFRQLRDQADDDTGQLAKAEADFFPCMICFVNA